MESAESFRKQFDESLSDLKTSEKSTISALTLIAQENKIHYNQIVNSISDRILRAPPQYKLAALHLMDSICKNEREGEYKRSFESRIPRLFRTVYDTTDGNTRNSLHRLLESWRAFFSAPIINEIDSFIQTRSDTFTPGNRPPPQINRLPPQINRSQMNQPMNKPMNPHMNQPINQPMNQPTIRRQIDPPMGNRRTVPLPMPVTNQNMMPSQPQPPIHSNFHRDMDPRNISYPQNYPTNDFQGVGNDHFDSGNMPFNQQGGRMGNGFMGPNSNIPINDNQQRFDDRNVSRNRPPFDNFQEFPLQRDFSSNPMNINQPPIQGSMPINPIIPAPTPMGLNQVNMGNPGNNVGGPVLNLPLPSAMNQSTMVGNIGIPGPTPNNGNIGYSTNSSMNLNMGGMMNSGGPVNSFSGSLGPYNYSDDPLNQNFGNSRVRPQLVNQTIPFQDNSDLKNGQLNININPIPGLRLQQDSPIVPNPILQPPKPDLLRLEDVQLTSESIKKTHPGAVEFIYENLPKQCGNCGFRYPDTEKGIKQLDQHLDWHFRKNRREKERRQISRDWFYSASVWCSMKKADDDFNLKVTQVEEEKEVKEETKSCVAYPHKKGDDICGLCEEKLVIYNDRETDQWKYKDAIRIDEQVYHYACYEGSDLKASKRKHEEETEESKSKKQK